MSQKILTKEIAEQFLILERSVDLDEFSILDDNASAVLSTYSGDALSFEGLTELRKQVLEIFQDMRGIYR